MLRDFRSLAPLATLLLAISTAACGGAANAGSNAQPSEGADTAPPPDAAPAHDATPEAATTVLPAACYDEAGVPEGDDAGAPAPTACINVAPIGDAGADAASDDGGTADAAIDPNVYPAFPIDAPKLVDHGGPVLANPRLVSVTWPDDTDADALDAFVDAIGSSKYWNQITCEYGIGPASAGPCNHVHMLTAPPATMSETQAEALVRNSLNKRATSGWPAPTKDSLYILFLSEATDLRVQTGSGAQSACQVGIGGYHSAVQLTDGTYVSYAVVPRCGGDVETATNSASHEIAEAALDADPLTTPGFRDFDDAHAVWNLFFVDQTENGDACEFYRDSTITSTELGHDVQRQFSFASFAAGHAPCVPVPSDPYFNVVPLDLAELAYDLPSLGSPTSGGHVTTRGVHVNVGETGSFRVGFYSDKSRGDWNLKVVEGNDLRGTDPGGSFQPAFANGNLSVSVDKTSGHNGDVATVTVAVKGKDATLGANIVTLVSSDPAKPYVQHYWPVLVTSD
jgi:hypothetical protein